MKKSSQAEGTPGHGRPAWSARNEYDPPRIDQPRMLLSRIPEPGRIRCSLARQLNHRVECLWRVLEAAHRAGYKVETGDIIVTRIALEQGIEVDAGLVPLAGFVQRQGRLVLTPPCRPLRRRPFRIQLVQVHGARDADHAH